MPSDEELIQSGQGIETAGMFAARSGLPIVGMLHDSPW